MLLPGRVSSMTYLIEPEVVRLKQFLEFREELIIVEGIDGLHITGAVVEITCDLFKMIPPNVFSPTIHRPIY